MKKLVFITLLIFSASVYSDVFFCTLKQRIRADTQGREPFNYENLDTTSIWKLQIFPRKSLVTFNTLVDPYKNRPGKIVGTNFKIVERSK